MSRAGARDDGAIAQVMAAAIQLGLPSVRLEAAGLAAQATRSGSSYLEFLAEVLAVECDQRGERRRARLMSEALFPRSKTLADFDHARVPGLSPALLAELAGGGWIERGEPLALIGDSGTGKTHLLIALGTAAAMTGRRVRYVTCAGLVNELIEAEDDKQLTRLINRYTRLALLCIDEVGYLHLDARGAELLFQVITARDETASVAVASNAPFSQWGNTFTDPRLAAAIVDRLTFNAHIINTGTTSYRLTATTARKTKP
jgi:DNA replication protein DnaC